MTTDTPHQARGVDLHLRLYRRLLVAYPRSFRDEYGEDLAQSFRDLMVLSTDGRGVWWRTTRDLVASASRERMSTWFGGRRPSTTTVVAAVCVVVAVLVVGPGPFLPLMVLPTLVLLGLPIYGVTRFRRAWLLRRTTGGAVGAPLALGFASFAAVAVVVGVMGEAAGYWIFVAVGLGLIVGSALGITWAAAALVRSGGAGDRNGGRRSVRPVLVLVPSVAILAGIIGGSYNSYRQSLGPPGDHSVAGASADTRALWEAANAGDVGEVVRITTETCADPWVKFPDGNGRHNAKGQAESRELDLPDAQEPPFRRIADILRDYMGEWYDRCGRSG